RAGGGARGARAGRAGAGVHGRRRRTAARARRSRGRGAGLAHRPRAGAPSLHRARDLRAGGARPVISLRGRRALVTGGSRGIGAATALLLAECGADVGIGYRSRESVAADISTGAGAESLFDRAAREFGGIDIFVGNAGIWPVEETALSAMDDARWTRTMEQNILAMFYTTRLAARHVSNGGRIVLVSSTAGQRGEAYHADYATSKGAMISLVKSLAVELAARDVTVNSVAPGWVD